MSKSKDVIETAMKYGIEFDDYWYERLRIVYNVINSSKAKDGHKRATMFKKLPTDPSLAFYYDVSFLVDLIWFDRLLFILFYLKVFFNKY